RSGSSKWRAPAVGAGVGTYRDLAVPSPAAREILHGEMALAWRSATKELEYEYEYAARARREQRAARGGATWGEQLGDFWRSPTRGPSDQHGYDRARDYVNALVGQAEGRAADRAEQARTGLPWPRRIQKRADRVVIPDRHGVRFRNALFYDEDAEPFRACLR